MGLFDHFPYTNVHELNLDWVLTMMKALEAEWDAFTAGNSLTFADPLQHDISKTYAKNTIVIDGSGNAYVSLQAVPVGVALSNQDYWLMVFDYEAFIEKVNKNFTARYYRGSYRATAAMVIGDWLTVDDVLCKATAAIAVDDVLEVGVNIEHFTLEDFIKAFMTSANQMIQQYKNDIDASELAYRQQLAQDIANTTASLQAQLDAAISGATVDSEVINARIGYNGVTYPTLGDAIRTQISGLYSYPFIEEPAAKAKAIVDVRFTSDNTQEFYLERIGRNVGGAHYIIFVDKTNNNLYQILNIVSANYTEPTTSEPQYFTKTVAGRTITGYYFVDWSILSVGEEYQSYTTPIFSRLCWRKNAVDKTLTKSNVAADSKAVGDLISSLPVTNNTYPFVTAPPSGADAIVDIHFLNNTTDEFYVERIGRNRSGAYYVIIVNKTQNTAHQVLNIAASNYTETPYDVPNEFDDTQSNGLQGYFYIDWSKIAVGAEYQSYTTPIFDRNCFKRIADMWIEPQNVAIPREINAVVGHPISLYFYNMFNINDEDGYTFNAPGGTIIGNRVMLGNRFKLYANTAGSYTENFGIYKNAHELKRFTTHINVLSDVQPTIKAIFIGDSFIDAGIIEAELLRMMGANLTLYGTVANSAEDSTGVLRSFYDEGHSGWSLKTYNEVATDVGGTVNNFYNNGFDFSYYITNHPTFSDVTDVFILSGPNDYGEGESANDYITYMMAIVNSIHSYNASIKVHLMSPLTANCKGYGWGVRNGNDAQPYRTAMFRYSNELRYKQSIANRIYYVPTHLYFDPIYDFPMTQVNANDRTPILIDVFNDNVHPNKYGYYCMADIVYGDIIAHS